MQRSSWILLSICVVLAGILGFGYVASKNSNAPLTQVEADKMLEDMKQGVHRKNVGAIMRYVSDDPDVKLASYRPEQIRMMLARSFAGSGEVDATTTNEQYQGTGDEATVAFDLAVNNKLSSGAMSGTGKDFGGRVTLHLRRTEVPHLLGLYHTPEWRVVAAELSGTDLSSLMDPGF